MRFQKRKKIGKGKKAIIVASTVIGILLIAVVSVFLYINSLIGKVNYKSLNSSSNSASSETKDKNGNPLMSDKDVTNILFVGLDNRTDTVKGGRSDSMIIISINKKTQRVILTSVMRDTYLPIAGHGSAKLNAAYAYGGINLLISTIQQNFDIKLDRYATVDFAKFINIVDELGGVSIKVNDNEVNVFNKYVEEINTLQNQPKGSGTLTHGGLLTLNGKQALAYSRIRYVGNADFERTERQRIVLEAIISKLKKQNVLQLTGVLNKLLPQVTTDMTQDELRGLVLNSMTLKGYKVVQNRIPIDGSYSDARVGNQSVLKVDFDKNIQSLKSVIYGTEASPNKSNKSSS